MNKIYKVMYSKVKQCAVVVSEIAKSHGHNGESSGVRKHAALTAAVLLALGSLSFTTAFVPMTAEADDKTRTDGSNFVGVERTNGLIDESKYENSGGKGANGADSITLGLRAKAGEGTITIGDRNAGASLGSVYVGQGDIAKPKLDTGGWVTSIGYNSDATGYGSIALGSNAVANNSYAKDSKGESLDLNPNFRLNSKPDIQRASVAIGYGAKADNGNIAIGSYSDASTDLRTAKPKDGKEIKSYLTDTMADSYVSVGKTGALRRISNVADGAADSDVATIGQLKALSDKAGVYKEGWGINIDKTNGNTISVNHNLGNNMNAQLSSTGLILGGDFSNTYDGKYGGAAGDYAVTLGGESNFALGKSSVAAGGMDNTADGNQAFVGGGSQNTASEHLSSAIGGSQNTASGVQSSAFGGSQNTASGQLSSAIGGDQNTASGFQSSAIGGDRNTASGWLSSTLGGMKSVVLGLYATGIAGGSTGSDASNALAAGSNSVVTVADGTAIGYQATTNERGTIAFGHDKDDISGYTVTWKQKATSTGGKYYNAKGVEITKDQYEALRNPDYTFNDYSKDPEINEDKYKTAAYNRLVKVADGKDDHDVVVMEQLKNASNVGNNIKVYKTDENGNVQFDENNKPIEDTSDAAKTAQNGSKDDWGQALGAGTFTTGTDTTPTNASISDQLVTGKTLYDYDKPTGSTNYVNANNTTGQNLSALDAQVKSNAKTLNDKTHNIKYYSVTKGFKIGDYRTNENNDGATDAALAGMAAGYETGTTGIASTVVGSYSGVLGSGLLQGAAAVSVGTVNVNNNSTSKAFSGVANSIVGQANMTTDSNAAIIVGAGNNVTNSYRDLDKDAFSNIKSAVASKDANALKKALQDAVPKSGGQVMVMGGGNNVESAYMSQVVGVGNTVTGADSTYAEGTSTQYNFVDGFQNELTNGKNDYIIGSNNSVTGDHIDKNQSNIVVGDNHTLTNRKNNVVIGSADKKENKNKELTASDATVIGHNADVTVDGGVAIGSDSVSTATAEADAEGYDPISTATNKASTNPSATWKATTGAVSIGANGTTTRRITNLAAGFNDTDAVNVAQIKELANIDASNIGTNLKGTDSKAAATTNEQNTNENAWGKAIGTGKIADSDASDKETNGSQQLVTGGTVYKALNGGMTKIVIGTPGENGKDGAPGTIGLVGPAGADGKNAEVDITIQQGKDEESKGVKGANGVDGQDGITRIVYKDAAGDHQVATMEDGLKFAGDDGQKDANKVIAKKLNNIVDIIGGAKGDLTEGNIGVNNDSGKLKIQLAQELTGITSISGSTGSNGAKITLDTKDQNISVNGGKITNVASGLSTNDGSYNAKDANNAANISDVNSMISKAVTDAKGETQQNLDKKANVDASNIGTNLKGADGKMAATEDEQKANLDKWGEAIGTGEVKDGSKQLVTGNTVYNAVKDKADKSYVDTQLNTKANTDGSNIDADKFSEKVAIGNINDSDERAVSGKTVHEAIQTINGNIDGKANKNLDNIDDAGKNVIKDQARAAVTIDNKGLNTNVVATQDDKNHTTTYTINVEGNGKVAAKDTGLISGDTIYNELRPATDGNYIKISNTTAQNLTSLDTQVRATHDLINSDGKTIKIGGSDAATKIDVNGKDGKGRVITGVVSDANDPNSAANVGYVNGLTAANTQQIYRDMNNAYGRLNNNINKAAAGSNALAALHPLDYDPDDKADFAVGYGHYRNANAAAVGAFYHPNENTMVNVGVSLGNGDPGFNAGVSFKVGRGGAGREAMSKTEMAKVINSQSKEIDALKKDNADKDKRIDALEQKMAEILAKLDKNGK